MELAIEPTPGCECETCVKLSAALKQDFEHKLQELKKEFEATYPRYSKRFECE
jgi:hypothetical protein